MAARRAGVIGWPVEHSRSPLIHSYWLHHYGIDGSYEKLAVPPEAFDAFVHAMPARGYAGANVTIPHKGMAARLCATLTPRAARLQSVNTIWFEDGQICGDSTDGQGFLGALDDAWPDWAARNNQALILGAGGAAAPIVDALASRGVQRIVVANRTLARAQDLAARFGAHAVALAEAADWLPTTDLLVNTTAVGMKNEGRFDLPLERLPRHAIVDDIVYVPLETALIGAAAALGLRTVGGLGMLLHQAAPGFERWFGIKPNVTPDLMARVAADVAAA